MIPTWAGPLLEFQQCLPKSESHIQQRLIPTWDSPLLEFQLGMALIGIPTMHGVRHYSIVRYRNYTFALQLYCRSDLVDAMLQTCLAECIHPILIILFK